ncbi:hypothetical protein EKN06_14480 [Croceicoccus ponticola]|uniref:Uncharacterized protein n=1 Tax=Croceicoccus ponticola TaxID=2217664 RepID=A0A437GUU3_9SPHN|nr:hypothetical protein [Croceicoccus ponticola]RVQ65004.1 hypothetical protein EKN06_14480 [Croceicoccus ponticola]
MHDDTDIAGALLSRVAGILEDVSTVAALRETATDAGAIVAMRRDVADASALLEAVAVLVTGRG